MVRHGKETNLDIQGQVCIHFGTPKVRFRGYFGG